MQPSWNWRRSNTAVCGELVEQAEMRPIAGSSTPPAQHCISLDEARMLKGILIEKLPPRSTVVILGAPAGAFGGEGYDESWSGMIRVRTPDGTPLGFVLVYSDPLSETLGLTAMARRV